MKKRKISSPILLIILISLTFIGCKEESLLEGKLYLTFVNIGSDLHIVIYPLDNEVTPIYEGVSNENNIFECTLNIGNYVVKPYSSTTFYPKTGFQIQSHKTIHVKYDSNNEGKVKY